MNYRYKIGGIFKGYEKNTNKYWTWNGLFYCNKSSSIWYNNTMITNNMFELALFL